MKECLRKRTAPTGCLAELEEEDGASSPVPGTARRISMKQEFQIKGELITLDALLKAVGAADSGAHAKAMVAEGLVRVDGEVELRKTRKLRGGERVELEGLTVVLKADPAFAARD